MKPVIVRRSAFRMWVLAIIAVPFVLYGADVLLDQRFVGEVLERMHPDGELPTTETRDLAWAWVFVIAGGGLALWALKELILPRKLIEGTEDHLTLRLGGPFSAAVGVPWEPIRDIRASRASDDGDVFPVLVVDFAPGGVPASLPLQPWGARWVESTVLAVSARDWDRTPERFVEQLALIRPRVASEHRTAARPLEARPSSTEAPAKLEQLGRPGPPGDPSTTPVDPEPATQVGSEADVWREPVKGQGLEWMRPRSQPDEIAGAGTPDRSSPARSPAERDAPDVGAAAEDRAAEVWTTVPADGGEPPPRRRPSVELPKSRFTASHWIILDEGDEP